MRRFITMCLLVSCLLTGCYPSVSNLAPQYPDLPWQFDENDVCAVPTFSLPPHFVPSYQTEGGYTDPDHMYNLAELIDLAQQANPETRIAWEKSKQAAFEVGLSLANYLPQISADALLGYQHTAIPLPKFVNPAEKIIIDTAQVFPSLVVQWLLFDFGKRDYTVQAAKQHSYASNVAFTRAHQQLIFNVAQAYFDFNAARTQLRVAEEALRNTEILQDAAESRLARGLEKTPKVAIARRETAKARFDLEKAKADDNDAYHGLLEAMGLTPTLKLQIADDSGRELPRELAGDVNTYICRALAQRPDIIQAFAKLNASKAEIGSAKASYYPTINLDCFNYQDVSAVGTKHAPTAWVNKPATAIFIGFQWPLYDGGMRRNTLEIACSKSAQAKEELRKTQDQAIRQVAKAYDMVKSALAEYDSALALVAASDIAYDSAIDSYIQGVGTFTDAAKATIEKAQAQSVLANAYATVLTTAAALAFSTGELTSSNAL
jgi:outer membrane protein